jgi:hypothetical protein
MMTSKHISIAVLFAVVFQMAAFAQNANKDLTLSEFWIQKHPNIWLQYESVEPYSAQIAVYGNNREYGFLDISGKEITPALYSSIYPLDATEYFSVNKDDKQGVFSPSGTEIIPVAYNYIKMGNQRFVACKGDTCTFFDLSGKAIVNPKHANFLINGEGFEGFYAATKDLKYYGIIDENGEWAIEPIFETISLFDGRSWVGYNKHIAQVIDPKKKWISPTKYTEVFAFTEDKKGFWAKKTLNDSYYTYYDLQGQPVPSVQSFQYADMGNDLNVFGIETKSGVMDNNGKVILPAVYSIAYLDRAEWRATVSNPLGKVKNKVIIAGNEDSLGIFYRSQWVIPQRFSQISKSSEYWYSMTNDSVFVYDSDWRLKHLLAIKNVDQVQHGFIYSYTSKDSIWNIDQGWIKLPKETMSVDIDEQTMIVTNKQRKLSMQDLQGKILLTDCDEIRSGHQMGDHAFTKVYKRKGFWGWIMMDGSYTEQPQYNQIIDLPKGGFLVQKNLRWGLANHKGQIMLPLEFDDVKYTVFNQYLCFKKDNEWKIYDLGGKPYMNQSFLEVNPDMLISKNGIWARNAEGWQVYQLNGKAVLPFSLPKIADSNNAGFYIKKNGKYGVVGFDGRIITPFEWDTLTGFWGRKGDQITFFDPSNKPKFTVRGQVMEELYEPSGYAIQRDSKWYFVKTDGTSYSETGYLSFERIYSTSFAVVAQADEKNWHCINKDGLVIQKIKADRVQSYIDDIVAVKKGNKKYLFKIPSGKKYPWKYNKVYQLGQNDRFVAELNNLTGLVDTNFKEIIPCRYKSMYPFAKGIVHVSNDSLEGLLSSIDGAVCIPLDVYDNGIQTINNDLFSVRKNGQVGLYAVSQHKWTPSSMEDIQSCNVRIPLAKVLFLIRVNGLYGIMDADCQHILAPKYTLINEGSGYLIQLKTGTTQVELFDPATKKVIGKAYQSAEIYADNTLCKNGDEYTLYHQSTPKFTRKMTGVNWFNSDCLLFKDPTTGQNGLLKLDGTVLLPPEYEAINMTMSQLIAVKKGGKIGFYDLDGQVILPIAFTKFEDYNYQSLIVYKNNLCGLYDYTGQELLPIQYENIKIAENADHFIVREKGMYRFLYRNGQPMVNGQWAAADEFSFGLAAVQKDNKWGYINLKGEVTIPYQYQYADRFQGHQERMAAVIKDNILMTIGVDGKQIQDGINSSYYSSSIIPADTTTIAYQEIPFTYFGSQVGGLLFVVQKGSNKKGLVNLLGQWVVRPEYENIEFLYLDEKRGVFGIQQNGLWGLMNLNGIVVVTPQFDKLEQDSKGKIKAMKGGNIELLNEKGERE